MMTVVRSVQFTINGYYIAFFADTSNNVERTEMNKTHTGIEWNGKEKENRGNQRRPPCNLTFLKKCTRAHLKKNTACCLLRRNWSSGNALKMLRLNNSDWICANDVGHHFHLIIELKLNQIENCNEKCPNRKICCKRIETESRAEKNYFNFILDYLWDLLFLTFFTLQSNRPPPTAVSHSLLRAEMDAINENSDRENWKKMC